MTLNYHCIMKMTLIYTFFLFLLFSCGDEHPEQVQIDDQGKGLSNIDTLVETNDKLDEQIVSDYDVSDMKPSESIEFKENLIKIEKKHGVQWGFCECVIKNDSINKAFESNLSDEEFDRLAIRLDEIDEKCKAFRVQNPNQTPEERADHEKKVRACLQEFKKN